MTLGSFPVFGSFTFNNISADNFVVLFPLEQVYDFFDLKEIASYLKVDLIHHQDELLAREKKRIERWIEENHHPYRVMTWKELNPSFFQVQKLLEQQFNIALEVLVFFVFIAVMEILTNTFLERIKEFGTLRAIGVNKKQVVTIMLLEIILLTLLSILTVMVLTLGLQILLGNWTISSTPPGVIQGHPIKIVLTAVDSFLISLFIVITALLSAIYPICKTTRKKIVEVLYHS